MVCLRMKYPAASEKTGQFQAQITQLVEWIHLKEKTSSISKTSCNFMKMRETFVDVVGIWFQ